MNEFKAGDLVMGWDREGSKLYWHGVTGTVLRVDRHRFVIVDVVKHGVIQFHAGNLRPAEKPVDPYNPLHMSPEKRQENEARIVGVMYGETEIGARNRKAREQMVAALGAEMRKPAEPRFPPEGRNDRVYRR